MRLSRRLTSVLAGAAAAALLAGCSGDAAPGAASESSPDAPSATALVRAAAAETDGQGSARYSLTTSTTVDGADVVFAGEGIYDWKADRGQTTYDVKVGAVQQRLVGPDLYLTLPQQKGQFFKLKVADVASSPLGGTVAPTAQLHTLAAVGEAERVGEEDVRGEPTTHYRGSYDVARALRGARGVQTAALRSSLGAAATVPTAEYDVFLDRAGLLRRLTQTVEVPQADGPPLTVTTRLELYDFGIDVVVNPPPGASVRDGAPLLQALRNALPQPSSRPAPPPTAVPSPTP
ncbi:MAG: hypothetical protein WD794_00080 [Mycobacteriales bacterium]